MVQFRILFISIIMLFLCSMGGMATIINVPDDAPTIQNGINQAVHGDTVLVKPGEYIENINFLGKRIIVASHFILNRNPKYIRETIINGDQRNTVVRFVNRETAQSVLSGFTITNGYGYGGGIYSYYYSEPTLENLIISENRSTSYGGGICIYYRSSPTINNVIIRNNQGRYGGGIFSYYSTPVIKNVTIIKNEADYYGGGFCNYYNSNPVLENVTIADNQGNYGGGVYNYSSSSAASVFVNAIIWNNVPTEIYGPTSLISISYSNVRGGWPGMGNFSADPQFADIANDYYHLKSTSPCIDHGNPGAAFNDGCLPPGQGSTVNDIGATGGPGNCNYFSYVGISADFAATDTIISPGDTCRFNDLSSGYIVNWEWDFDNNGTIDAPQQNPTWAYTDMGLYSIKLIASNEIESDTLIKENYIGVIDEAAIIDTVVDIPHDQGGYVSILFTGSNYDCCSDLHNITKYSIWRKMNLNAFTKKAAINFSTIPTTEFFVNNAGYWEYIGEFEAAGFASYAYTAPTIGITPSDWWKCGTVKKYWNTYLVIAHTDNPNIYYKSEPDSGFSVDNISCGYPKAMQANATDDGHIEVNWEEASEKDFNFFRLERSVTPQFAETETDIIAETRENTVLDTKVEIGVEYYYRATAVDSNYNVSEYSEIVKAIITIGGTSLVPDNYALHQNFPNPFNATTEIKYDLPEETYTNISIYNIAGQLIEVVLDKKMPAGYHSVKVHTPHYGSGMYIYRISTPGFTASKKFLLLK